MLKTSHRHFKDELYRDLARVGSALANPKRLEMLTKRLKSGRAILLDVRPEAEFQAAHIAGARAMPIKHLADKKGTDVLPRNREIIVYCRGPYCVWADEAVDILRSRGFKAGRLLLGAPDWADLGGLLETAGRRIDHRVAPEHRFRCPVDRANYRAKGTVVERPQFSP